MIARQWTSSAQALPIPSTLESSDLRRRVRAILAAEESEPPEWAQVARLSDELQRQLLANPKAKCPAIVSQYIDDSDIRMVNNSFAKRQRDKIRHFVVTGNCREERSVKRWAIAVGLALPAAALIWLLS